MAEVNFSPKLAGSLISILPRNAAAKTFENRSSDTVKMDCACRQFAMGLIRCGGTSPL
jgi:hypothetical protein